MEIHGLYFMISIRTMTLVARKMGLILVAAFSLVAYVSGFANISINYHANIGIPAAEGLKRIEEKILSEPSLRIIQGEHVGPGANPYLAGLIASSIYNTRVESVCGSTLLSPNRLVTAAHCWYDGRLQMTQFTVVLGSPYLFWGGLRIPTSNVVTHPFWNPRTITNDVAMIGLPYPVSFSAVIQPVSLPYDMLGESFLGQWAVAAGYGKYSDRDAGVRRDTTRQQVELRVISVPECQWTYGYLPESVLCTSGWGGVGVCAGDSGGPLVIYRSGKPILIGVTSFTAEDACEKGMPSGFSRVTSFIDFITGNM